MRRTIPATAAALLVLGAAPVMATEVEQPAADATTLDEAVVQTVEAPAAGLALDFPADWRVSLPEGTRESPIRTTEGEPVYATTAVLANGGGGRWCDVDV